MMAQVALHGDSLRDCICVAAAALSEPVQEPEYVVRARPRAGWQRSDLFTRLLANEKIGTG